MGIVNSRRRKFLSYYKPYTGLLVADLACALGAAVIALILPLCVRHITKDLLDVTESVATEQIYTMGLVMLVLVILHGLFHMFVSYQGHMMGALMERDMRAELFDHYQKMSFGFYDDRQTGELMNRMTNDTFWLGELCHHGPEDIVITSIKFFGTFIVLLTIDVQLTLIVFAFFPPMAAYAFYFNRQMNVALRASKDRIGDINAQAEDSLAGVRVVKSFTNAAIERAKFAIENDRFVEAKGEGYRSESYL